MLSWRIEAVVKDLSQEDQYDEAMLNEEFRSFFSEVNLDVKELKITKVEEAENNEEENKDT